MSLANKITILRILLVPIFAVAVFLSRQGVVFVLAALVIFICVGVSDFLDGYFARRRNEKTRLGMMLDPLADKLTMVTAVILLGTDFWPEFTRLMPWTVISIVSGDVLIIAGALILREIRKNVIDLPPIASGKFNTASQLVLIPFVLFFQFLRDAVPADVSLEGLQICLKVMQWWVIAWVIISFTGYVRKAVIILTALPSHE